MYKRNTSELEKKLENVHPNEILKYLDENKDEMLSEERDFMKYMKEKFKEKGIKANEIFVQADIPMKYGYKLLSEEKHTNQRDIILRICYASEFTLQETQHALKLYQMEALYARNERDALIMACFNMRPGSIIDVNELLVSHVMEPLRSCGTLD